MNKPAARGERERFPNVVEQTGEDPARFLDIPIFDPGSEGSSPFRLAEARIRGIDEIATVRAWIAVERALDRGPRDKVIELLYRREEQLEDIGERHERAQESNKTRPPKEVVWTDREEGERSAAYVSADRRTLRADGGR